MLSSYDVVSKSIPGVVVSAVAVSLYPDSTDVLSIPIGNNLADYALVLFASLLLALFIGEGIHIAGIFFEKTMLFLGRSVYSIAVRINVLYKWIKDQLLTLGTNLIGFILGLLTGLLSRVRDALPSVGLPEPLKSTVSSGNTKVEQAWNWARKRPGEIHQTAVDWLHRRYWGLHDTFKGHRLLFADSLMWNFAKGEGLKKTIGDRWDQEEKDLPYDRFNKVMKKGFDKDIQKINVIDLQFENQSAGGPQFENGDTDDLQFENELQNLYTMVRAEIGAANTGQSARYQAVYAFCRSMYLVCLLTALTYAVVLGFRPTVAAPFFTSTGTMYKTILFASLPSGSHGFIPVVSLGLAIVFMIGTGRYKRHFVDYTIAEFTTAVGQQYDTVDTTDED